MLDDSENEDPEATGAKNVMSSKKGLRMFLLIVVEFTFSVFASTAGVSAVSVFGGLGTPENIGNILCTRTPIRLQHGRLWWGLVINVL